MSIYESQLPQWELRPLRENLGGVELDVEVGVFSAADCRKFCRSTWHSANRPVLLNGPAPCFQRGACPTTVTKRCSLSPPHLSNTHTQTHTLICISFPFALSTKTCLTRKHYSTESKWFWRQVNGNEWKVTQDCVFVFIFFSFPDVCRCWSCWVYKYMVKSSQR